MEQNEEMKLSTEESKGSYLGSHCRDGRKARRGEV